MAHTVHIEGYLEHIALGTQEQCDAGPIVSLIHEVTSPTSAYITYLIYRNKHRGLGKRGDREICSRQNPRTRNKQSGDKQYSQKRIQGSNPKGAQ